MSFMDVTAMPPLEGHTSTVIGNYVVAYGGKTSPSSLNGDAFALELHSGVWRRLIASGEVPLPRAYHTTCRYHSRLFVFGGLTAISVDDVHFNSYNVFANVDALPEDMQCVPADRRVKDQVSTRYVTQQRLESNSLHCLDLNQRCSWSPVVSHGTVPPTRSHHVACVFRGNMFVYGGYSCHAAGRVTDEEVRALHVLYSLHLDTMLWTVYDTASAPTSRLYGMSSCMFGTFWLVHGGVDLVAGAEANETWVFNLTEGSWRRVPQGTVPPLAFSSAAVLGDTMYLVGGSSDRSTRFHSAMYCFDLLKGYWWHKVLPKHEGPPPHCKGTLVVAGRELLSIGGLLTSFRRIDSVFAFDVERGTWRELPARFEATMLLDNVRGLESLAAVGPRPAVLGGQQKAMQVSQGAQTVAQDVDYQTRALPSSAAHVLNSRNIHSPIGDDVKALRYGAAASSMAAAAPPGSYDVWATTTQNDLLFGMARGMQKSREAALETQKTAAETAAYFQEQILAIDCNVSPDRRLLPYHSHSFQAGSPKSAVEHEIESRRKRLEDLAAAGSAQDAQSRVHTYWQSELAQLSREHERWREATRVDRDVIRSAITVVDDAPMHHAAHRAVGGVAANPMEGCVSAAIFAGQTRDLREEAKIEPFVRGSYISPSIAKLGLTETLMRRRQKN